MLAFNVAALCDLGKKRSNNEDCIALGAIFLRDARYSAVFDSSSPLLLLVADGMGGANAGEVASEFAIRQFSSRLPPVPNSLSLPNFEELNQYYSKLSTEVHTQLVEKGLDDPFLKGMGTTLSGILVLGELAYVIHIGDTRVYRHRNGITRQISRDHTLREMSGNPNVPNNILVNSLGGGKQNYCDFFPLPGIKPGLMLAGDLFMISSDGLHDYVSHDRVEEILSQATSLVERAQALCELAYEVGAPDNVSIVLVEVQGENPVQISMNRI